MQQIEPLTKEKIALEVIRVLWGRFNKFPKEEVSTVRNAPFHTAFLQAFTGQIRSNIDMPYVITMSSWLHGLNTTLGQSFFENVAHILSGGEKRVFTEDAGTQLYVTNYQQRAINEIITDLKSKRRTPNFIEEDNILGRLISEEGFQSALELTEIPAWDFSADNFVEDDISIEAIELKSVRPNAGEIRGEKQKILFAKAALRRKYPHKQVRFYFGFPFDPWNNEATSYDKSRFLSKIVEGEKYLDPAEVLLADELWNRLSCKTNTMQQLMEIINSIATPDFPEIYEFLKEPRYIESEPDRLQYLDLVEQWGLLSEKEIVLHIDHIVAKAKGQKKRTLYNPVFLTDAKYNIDRHNKLLSLLN